MNVGKPLMAILFVVVLLELHPVKLTVNVEAVDATLLLYEMKAA